MAALTALAIASIATSIYGTVKGAGQSTPQAPTLPSTPAAPTPVDAGPTITQQRRARASGMAAPRSATLLTGPSGATAPAATERKTLLGL